MDFVTHLPRTPQGHDAVWVIMDSSHEVNTFSSHADDHEYYFPPTDRWSVREDNIGVRGHAASMRPGS